MFTPDTLITLEDGRRIPIGEVRPKDKVLTYYGWPATVGRVRYCDRNSVGGVCSIQLVNQSQHEICPHELLIRTTTHQIFRTDHGLVTAGDLVPGDRLITANYTVYNWPEGTNIDQATSTYYSPGKLEVKESYYIFGEGEVCALVLQDDDNYVAGGIYVVSSVEPVRPIVEVKPLESVKPRPFEGEKIW